MDLKTPITSLKQIDTTTLEGRLLFAAVGKIKNRCDPGKSCAEILQELNLKAAKIFENDNPGRDPEQ